MFGQALLIGSEVDGPTGTGNDLDALGRALLARGMSVTHCAGREATRAGILEACAHLIETVRPGQPVVLYYSGPSGRVVAEWGGDSSSLGGVLPPEPSDVSFIVPVDFHESTESDFRGITSVELMVILARLSRITKNITVIFEASHAASLAYGPSRPPQVPSEALPIHPKLGRVQVSYELLQAHIYRLYEAGGLPADMWRLNGNPDVVRLSACAAEQLAFDYQGIGGQQIGVFTESLVLALNTAGDSPVTWAAVLDYIRGRVLTLTPSQRPEIAGPVRRLLFDTAEQDPLSSLPVTGLPAGRASLACAPLLGVQHGDRFMIMPPGEVRADPSTGIGWLEVDQVGPLTAQGAVTFLRGVTAIPMGARAFRVAAAAQAAPILLPALDPRAAGLVRAVASQPLLRAAEPAEPWLAALRIDSAGQLILEDRIGPIAPPRRNDAAGIESTILALTDLARAAALRTKTGDPQWALDAPVTFSWGLVDKGQRHPLPAAGATVYVGQKIYFSVRNDSSQPLYFSLLDIGVAASIDVLTSFSPSGMRLEPGREYVLGFDHDLGVLQGLAMAWPEHMSLEHARLETVLLLVTQEPQDVGALEQVGLVPGRGRPASPLERQDVGALEQVFLVPNRGRPASPLEAMFDQIASGTIRTVGVATSIPGRYDIHAIDFELDPVVSDIFAIDERLSKLTLLRAAQEHGGALTRQADPQPPTVAVRLDKVIVHDNRTLFRRGRADVRLDAVVVTGPHGKDLPAYQVRTARFPRIRSGDELPVDRMLLYHGPAVEYLDLALWISRDGSGSRDLGELLAEEFAGFEMQEAMAKASDTVTAVPYALAAITALSLSAVCINVAYKCLHGTVNSSIGLYRGSMLAHEDFRVGRHTSSGEKRRQGASLVFSIEQVSTTHGTSSQLF